MTTGTTGTSRAARAHAQVPTARVLARTCAAEWSRLWTVRTTWLLLSAAALVMVGAAAAAGSDASSDADTMGDPAWTIAGITLLPGQFAFLTLALVPVTSDYATGGIVPTLQWTARRTTVFLARTLIGVAVATTAAVLLALAASATAYLLAGSALTLPLDEGVDVLTDVAFVVAAGAALATGLGFLLRSTAGVLVTVFLTMLVLPVMLPNLPLEWGDDVAQQLPGAGAAYLLVGEVEGMTTGSSVAVMLGWAVGALVLGWLRLVRTDANA